MSSPEIEMHRDTSLEDFVVATSDRRRELRGERWDGLRRAVGVQRPLANKVERTSPSARFETGMRFEAHEAEAYRLPESPAIDLAAAKASTPAQKLALLLRHSVWPLRWEPLNGSGQHRAVPTPGALFPVDAYLMASMRQGPRALYCSPRDLCLLDVAALPAADAQRLDEASSLILVGNLGRCVGIYGDLALSLAALEIGMLQAQLVLVAEELGWRLRSALDPAPAHSRVSLGIAHWSELPVLHCRLQGEGVAQATAALSSHRLATFRPLPHHAAADAHPLMREIVRSYEMRDAAAPAHIERRDAPFEGASDESRGVVATDTLSAMALSERRSSGLSNGVVRWTRDFPAAAMERWLVDTRTLLHRLIDAPPTAGLPSFPLLATLAWRRNRSGEPVLLDLDPPHARYTEIDADAQRLELVRGMCQNGTVALVTIGIDAAAFGRAADASSYLAAHLAAGAWSQAFCLAAAANGLVARIFQAYPDEMKNPLLPLQARTLVQILVGYDPRPNPAFRIP
jgi:hypothetical protein